MENKIRPFTTLSVAFLITGNLIGAGILALPVNTGLAGFVPSLVAMLFVGAAMYYSAVVMGGEAIREKAPTFNYPSLYHTYLGSTGKWTAIFANLLILYGLLTAYLTGATSIITNLFHIPIPQWLVLVIFFLIITGLNVTEMSLIRKYNVLLVILLWLSFAVIVIICEGHVEVKRYAFRDWAFLPATIPIMITSFHFHNIIPHVCHTLNWKFSTVWKAMLFGMLIGYLMNAIWIQVGVGALPLTDGDTSLIYAFDNNLPATVPLSKLIESPIFVMGSLLFALLAIATSYLATGIGLLGFFDDLTKNHFNVHSRFLSVVLAFGPPFVISLVYPDIFLKAINVVGGVGIALLFGILPCFIAMKGAGKSHGKKMLAYAMIVLFSSFLVFELCQEFGLLKLKPEVEDWTTYTKHVVP